MHSFLISVAALFMTAVTVTFILVDRIGLGLPASLIPWIAGATFAISIVLFYLWKFRNKRIDYA